MDDKTYYGEVFPIDDTICKDCIHRVSRIIVPLDPEEFGLDEEAIKEMDLSEDETIVIEQHTCLITNQDMDYLVKGCTKFCEKGDCSIFKTNPYV